MYSNRLSEKTVGKFIKNRSERIYLATKCGRFFNPHTNENYTVEGLRNFVETSLSNTGLETLDLIQLHCPPTAVYYRPEIFGLFERLKEEGKILHLGVSVEKVEEALKAIEFENVTTVQIIFNMFRHRPAELFFRESQKRDIGVIVRVPLASGLLTGKYTESTTFGENDHRTFNRNGEAFDKGETFSGIEYQKGLRAVEELKSLLPRVDNLASFALRWILQFPEVSTIIPGASRPEQVAANLSTHHIPALTVRQMDIVNAIYEKHIKATVHHLW